MVDLSYFFSCICVYVIGQRGGGEALIFLEGTEAVGDPFWDFDWAFVGFFSGRGEYYLHFFLRHGGNQRTKDVNCTQLLQRSNGRECCTVSLAEGCSSDESVQITSIFA